MSEEFTTLDKMHHKIDSELILEHIVHANEELVFDCVQDLFLKLNVFKLLILKNNIFTDTLHSIKFLGFSVLDKENFSESTFTEHFTDFEILKLGVILLSVKHISATTRHTHSSLAINIIKTFISKI